MAWGPYLNRQHDLGGRARVGNPRLGGRMGALLAGLATPNQTPLNPFGSFQAGLAGALGQYQAESDQQAMDAAEQLKRDMEERQYGLDVRKVGAQELEAQAAMRRAEREPGSSGSGVSFEDWLKMPADQQALFKTFKNVTDNPHQPTMFERWRDADPEGRRQIGEFMNLDDNGSDPLLWTVTDVVSRDPVTGLPTQTKSTRFRRSDKVRKERIALDSADAAELRHIINDQTLEPETREEAKRRMQALPPAPPPQGGRRDSLMQ